MRAIFMISRNQSPMYKVVLAAVSRGALALPPTSLMLSLAVVVMSCKAPYSVIDDDQVNREDLTRFEVFGFPYEPSTGQLRVCDNVRVDGVIQLTESGNGDWAVFTKATDSRNVDLFVVNRGTCVVEQLTDSPAIEFDPAVNNDGLAAYAVHSYSVGQSTVVVGSQVVDLPTGLYHNIALSQQALVCNRVNHNDDAQWLVVHDLLSGGTEQTEIPIVASGVELSSQGTFIVQGVDSTFGVSAVMEFDIATSTYQLLCEPPCVLVDTDGVTEAARVDELTEPDALAILAANALDAYDPLCSLAGINNHLGRLSWGSAYRILGLLSLLEAGVNSLGEDRPPIDHLVEASARRLIANASTDPNMPGWPTTKYSRNLQAELSLMVTNAMILYPLLRAYNLGVINDSVAEADLIRIATELFEYYEQDFDPDLGGAGGYRFRRGIDYTWDGVVQPFNQQNVFGLAMLELYRTTGEDAYRDRATELAVTFRSEFVDLADGRVVWHYWPQAFYAGWNATDDISDNTPQRGASSDALFEDIGHAGLNVAFVLEFAEAFPDQVFQADEIDGIRQALTSTRHGDVWSQTISGTTDHRPASLQFKPYLGWIQLGDPQLISAHASGSPEYYPPFDGDLFSQYAMAYAALRGQ